MYKSIGITAVLTCTSVLAEAQSVSWVGYQTDCTVFNPLAASFHDGTQWFGFEVPGENNAAYFSSLFDPQDNGIPRTVHFGDFTPSFVDCSDVFTPGSNARVDSIEIESGTFNFRIDGQTLELVDGSLRVGESLSSGITTSATLNISGGTLFTARGLSAGDGFPNRSDGTINVFGSETLLDVQGFVWVGGNGHTGVLEVSDGSEFRVAPSPLITPVNGRQGAISISSGSTENDDRFIVRGQGTRFVSSVDIFLGDRMELRSGSATEAGIIFVHNSAPGHTARLIIDGIGTTAILTEQLMVVDVSSQPAGNGRVDITNGAHLVSSIGASPSGSSGIISFGNGAGEVYVSGTNSMWTQEGLLNVGWRGDALFEITSGGLVQSRDVVVARTAGSTGRVEVRGTSSSWQVDRELVIGGLRSQAGGVGQVIVSNNGAVGVGDALHVWDGSSVDLSAGGSVRVGNVAAPAQSGQLQVGDGGILSGTGTVVGDVSILGGMLEPGASPGQLSIEGDLSLATDATVVIEIDGAIAGQDHDVIDVTGDLALGGTLLSEWGDGFSPEEGSQFRIFQAGGLVSGSFFDIQSSRPDVDLNFVLDGAGGFSVAVVPEL